MPYPQDKSECGKIAKLAGNERPPLAANLADISQYDTIFIGYPVWYGTTPMAVRTFLEAHDFSGKVLVPFCTSKKSGIEKSLDAIAASCPQAYITKGLALQDIGTGKMQRLISSWLEGVRGEIDTFGKKRTAQ